MPVVPYGSGTGLMGGARTLQAGVVLDTSRLQDIDVHADDRYVWAGAGIVLQELDARLTPYGLCIGHDPWTFPVATVGGTLSTNGLGYKGGRYGGMGDQAIALEVALADGTLFRTRAVTRNSAGPRLDRLFIGAEGVMGVITAAALKAHPLPEQRVLHAYRFDSFESGFQMIDGIAGLGLRPSLLDYGEEHASLWPELTSREDELPILYLGFEGLVEEVDASWLRAEALAQKADARGVPDELAWRFWNDRHVIAERFSRSRRRQDRPGRSPDLVFDYMHVALPASKVLEFRQRCHDESARSGVGLLECGLWTGPELFSAVFAMPVALGGREKVPALIDTLLRAVQDCGGSMEYVHGAGLRYAHLMQREHGEGFEVLQRLKAALDPGAILNPGKLGL
jgi:alkyldihydroxyacetonephosphate synthase